MIEIAELVELDLEDLGCLYEQFWGEKSSLEKMSLVFRRLDANPNYILLGAKENKCLAGSVMGIVCEELYGKCEPFMVIEDVIVDKNYRRRGVGSELMGRLEEYANDRGCSYIILVTDSGRAAAIEFYQSLGYEPDRHKGFKKKL